MRWNKMKMPAVRDAAASKIPDSGIAVEVVLYTVPRWVRSKVSVRGRMTRTALQCDAEAGDWDWEFRVER